MKAEELRIGNYVRYLGVDTTINVVSNGFISTLKSGAIAVGQADPIPLTEEWLLKFGAKKVGIEYKLKASALEITIRINAGNVYCEFGNVYLGGRVQYVHELQNLVHSLCGKELKIESLEQELAREEL